MLIVYPADPSYPRRPDAAFADEASAAAAVGFAVGFAGLELHADDEVTLRIPPGSGPALYRGWMLSTTNYEKLDLSLAARGYELINDCAAYAHSYSLPDWYEAIGGASATPRSIWFAGSQFDLDAIAASVAAAFRDQPVILKDYVKSRKHEWFDACFIRDASDATEVKRVTSNFLRLQDDSLVGGLVFREFIEFKQVGLHSKSRMPLVREYRLFILDGAKVTNAPYWGEGNYEGDVPDFSSADAAIARVKSRFFAIDVAQKAAGDWLIMEINDGGSAGIPEGGDLGVFYQRLAHACNVHTPE